MNQKPPSPADAAKAQALYRSAVEALSAGRFAQAVAPLEQAHALMPRAPEILNNLGTACWKTGRTADALRHYAQAVRLAPDSALALTNYGALLMEQGQLDEAEQHLARAAALKPEHPSVANNRGLMACRRGEFAAAEEWFRAALTARPNWAEAQENLGDACRDLDKNTEAESAYRRAIELDPQNSDARASLGALYIKLQRNAEAETALRGALQANPDAERPWDLLLLLLEMTNRLDEAQAVLNDAKTRFAASPRIAAVEAKLLRRGGKSADALALLERHLPIGDADWPGIHFFFELGQLYDETGETDKAFAAFRRANEIQAATPRARAFDKTAHAALAARTKAFLTPAAALTLPKGPPEETATPVFLVGFPRSGTTLLDQILSSHPGVQVAEERPGVAAMVRYLRGKYEGAGAPPAYPSALAQMTPEDFTEVRRAFFRALGGDGSGKILVDKMPVNMMHAALIRTVFPRAKFILALRHPCDCTLSAYMQAFSLNPAMARFNDLKDAARFYDEMFSTWEHAATVLPLAVHTVRYEDVVADFRPTVAALLEYLGLPWDEAVMAFDKTARAKERINTASYAQVTQKLYTRASGRWRRYRPYLAEVLEIVAPYAEKYGYTLS